ncbi:MAG: prephenate dehydratase, partial [Chloroflexota bacterium]
MRLGYLGPSGTYSETAARTYRVHAEMTPYPSIPAVAEAVERGEVEEAVVPIENSLQGAVTEVLDFLLNSAATRIRGELAIPIAHCLLAPAGTRIENVEVVYSHPQALGQCHRYLRNNLPHAELRASASTAGSVSDMLESKRPAAAIAPRRAAEIYGVETLAEGIQDNPENYT